jgi:hypothetical protein
VLIRRYPPSIHPIKQNAKAMPGWSISTDIPAPKAHNEISNKKIIVILDIIPPLNPI